MNRKKFAIALVILLIVVYLFLNNAFNDMVVSKFVPTQTSIFNGPLSQESYEKLRVTQWNGMISREQAIGLAELYCAQVHSEPTVNPSNIRAYLISEKQAQLQFNSNWFGNSLFKHVWFVSMDGAWEHTGGPAMPNQTPPAIILNHCNSVIDPKTGEFMIVTN